MYVVYEDKKKDRSEHPEKTLSLWLGQGWREKLDRLEESPDGTVYKIHRLAKKIKIYRI